MMKKIVPIIVAVVVIIGGGAFYGGIKYAESGSLRNELSRADFQIFLLKRDSKDSETLDSIKIMKEVVFVEVSVLAVAVPDLWLEKLSPRTKTALQLSSVTVRQRLFSLMTALKLLNQLMVV